MSEYRYLGGGRYLWAPKVWPDYSSDATTDATPYHWAETTTLPTKWQRQQARFRDQLARRRGRYLALELSEAVKAGNV